MAQLTVQELYNKSIQLLEEDPSLENVYVRLYTPFLYNKFEFVDDIDRYPNNDEELAIRSTSSLKNVGDGIKLNKFITILEGLDKTKKIRYYSTGFIDKIVIDLKMISNYICIITK